ncbi:hypothetical protein O0L34_g4428 [Tuta absoluta]|nr:hypothetical protein O0L34_g4428 [Tuta absoluta]
MLQDDDELYLTSKLAGSSSVIPQDEAPNSINQDSKITESIFGLNDATSDIEVATVKDKNEKPINLEESTQDDADAILDPTTGEISYRIQKDTLSLSNVSEEKENITSDNDDFELILDPTTGHFCKKRKTEMNNLMEIDQDLENNDLSAIEKENTRDFILPEKKQYRKRKLTNAFKQSCIDFLDEETNDFSGGSSDLWSANESDAESAGSDERDRKKKKKKKIGQNIQLLKIKKENVRKTRKKKKDNGESYETKSGKVKEAKSMKENPCLDGVCKRSCKDVTEERRKSLFDFYWKLDPQRRRDWLLRCAHRVPVKRKKTKNDLSRRNVTYEYFIN